MRLAPFAVVALVAALVTAQETRTVPTFSSGVELVTVDAVVLDREGRPVRGLVAGDFTLSEDGKPQTIASFESFDLGAGAGTVPESLGSFSGPAATNVQPGRPAAGLFVLLVDDMSLSPTRQETVRTALTRFLTDGVRDGDELVFATTSGDMWWSARIPEGREDLLALAARVRGRSLADNGTDVISDWEAYRVIHVDGKGGDGGSTSQPERRQLLTQPGFFPQSVSGAETSQRILDRYYQRRVCVADPTPPPAGPPMTPEFVCKAMVQARAQAVDVRRAGRTRDVLAAVDRAVFALTGVRGRKSLLLLTEGFLNDPGLDVAKEVTGRCREANIAVYSLDVRGLISGLAGAQYAGTPNTMQLGLMQTERVDFDAAGSVSLAEDTGGFAVRDTNDLLSGAARVAEESRAYYLFGYAPPEGKGARDWRTLKVEIKRPGLTVRARKGYTLRTAAQILAAADAELAAKSRRAKSNKGSAATEPPALPAEMVRALSTAHDIDAIPLRAMTYAFEGRPDGRVRTLFAVEADIHSLANLGGEDRPRAVLSFSITATHRDSGKSQRLDQRIAVDAGIANKAWEGWLALSRELDLAPGVNQARVVVRDEFLGRLGAVTLRFVVPAETGLRVSAPLLSDRLTPARPGELGRPVLVAHREFDARSPLYCQFQVLGAKESHGSSAAIEASYELRRKDGDVVRRSEARVIAPNSDGRLVGFLAMTLDGVAQGDYELVVRIEDKATGEKRERVEALRIARSAG